MSLLGNIVWLVFGGFFTGIGYILGGLLVCLTIVGIPFGLQAIKLGFASFTPFGKEIVEEKGADSTLKLIFDILWVILFGWEIAIAHLTAAAVLAITIIGLPFAKQHLKLIILAFLPFGRDLRPIQ